MADECDKPETLDRPAQEEPTRPFRRLGEQEDREEALHRQRTALTGQLKAMFDEVAAEPLPEAFDALLNQLEDDMNALGNTLEKNGGPVE